MRHAAEPDRVLATVLSCWRRSRRRRCPWRFLRTAPRCEREIEWFRGREVDRSTATRLVATFDGPARAIRCAEAHSQALRRAGARSPPALHTGECDLVGETLRDCRSRSAPRSRNARNPANPRLQHRARSRRRLGHRFHRKRHGRPRRSRRVETLPRRHGLSENRLRNQFDGIRLKTRRSNPCGPQ